jgi:hypothetical protein
MKTLSKAIALASLVSATALTANVANAEVEVSASAAVSNMYLWRGLDLGDVSTTNVDGDDNNSSAPAVSADITVSMSGAYAGVWTSSGDATSGQEYDLYVGYGFDAGSVSIDASVWTYIYPSGEANNEFDLTELIISASFADASVTLYESLSSNINNGRYVTLGYGMGDVSVNLGLAMSDVDAAEYTHLDLSYGVTENLSFTYSQIVDEGVEGSFDTSGKIVAVLSLPIE